MVQIGNYVVDVTSTLQDSEVLDLCGIENDDRQLEIAYDIIDWDAIADEMYEHLRALVAKRGSAVRAAIEQTEYNERMIAEIDALEDDSDEGEAATGGMRVWCRFDAVPKGAGNEPWYPPLDIDDIRAALDEIPTSDLPEWGEDWLHVDYDYGNNLVSACLRTGLIDGRAWQSVKFDGMDEPAYEDYYDERLRREGLPAVER